MDQNIVTILWDNTGIDFDILENMYKRNEIIKMNLYIPDHELHSNCYFHIEANNIKECFILVEYDRSFYRGNDYEFKEIMDVNNLFYPREKKTKTEIAIGKIDKAVRLGQFYNARVAVSDNRFIKPLINGLIDQNLKGEERIDAYNDLLSEVYEEIDSRKSKVSKLLFNKGGNSGTTIRVTLPREFVERLGITKEDRDVVVSYKNSEIIIKKK